MKPIYEPKGMAKEYGDYAVNIYTGCPHCCHYCFAPGTLRRSREQFHTHVEPRTGIVEAVHNQIEQEKITDKLIHLCFTCDPYPMGYDTTPTRAIIALLKSSGNHVQILTKGDGTRDFDLLDSDDWYGVTIDGLKNPKCLANDKRVQALYDANAKGIKTWVSFEPVLCVGNVIKYLRLVAPIIDSVKFGKLNHFVSPSDWKDIGRIIESECHRLGVNYYIKESLREEMNRSQMRKGKK